MSHFDQYSPSLESYWRSIILFGRNSASYKFALAKSLLDLASAETTTITLEALAVPFARHITEHMTREHKQGTSTSSRFLAACAKYNQGESTHQQLLDATVSLGFTNVIDAFHVVNQAALPVRFFLDERATSKRIVITDELLKLKESVQFQNLPLETEARWRLVETAWSIGIATPLLQVSHEHTTDQLFITTTGRRKAITSARDALNGYQKGKCFYCFADISIDTRAPDLADVDHFFPHALMQLDATSSLDGVWNLVLACYNCNRGPGGKFMRVPAPKYLERLDTRNTFLIESHHPLRETLIMQTGATPDMRRRFLTQHYREAKDRLIYEWSPAYEHAAAF